MPNELEPGFLLTAVLFAAAISAEAALLTVCEFEANAERLRARRWIVWVRLAHWGLAAIGLTGSWMLREAVPALLPAVRLLTAAMLGVLIVHAARQLWHSGPAPESAKAEGPLGFAAEVWLVSVDALFVGAAENAVAGHWSRSDLIVATLLLAPLIFAWMLLALAAARWVRTLVSGRRLDARAAAVGAGLGRHLVVLPIFSYLALCALRGSRLL